MLYVAFSGILKHYVLEDHYTPLLLKSTVLQIFVCGRVVMIYRAAIWTYRTQQGSRFFLDRTLLWLGFCHEPRLDRIVRDDPCGNEDSPSFSHASHARSIGTDLVRCFLLLHVGGSDGWTYMTTVLLHTLHFHFTDFGFSFCVSSLIKPPSTSAAYPSVRIARKVHR